MFDDEAIRTRRTQAQRLRARLDDWVAGNGDKDVVVVGDFNDLPGSAALAEITGRRRGGSGASGFVNTGARLPESAVTYLGRTSRIDHIVVSSPAVSQEEWTGQVAIYPKPRGAARRAYEASVSDHLPSWATFKVDRDNDP
jgi:endonuclease/exonuclease/phosphatase family metal-dependent hydrolase